MHNPVTLEEARRIVAAKAAPKPSFLEAWHMNHRVKNVWDDWSLAKPREECIPFTYTLDADPRHGGPNLQGQSKFVKGLEKLTKLEAREAKRKAKAAA